MHRVPISGYDTKGTLGKFGNPRFGPDNVASESIPLAEPQER